MKIGVTERGDAALDKSWAPAVILGRVDGAILVTKRPSVLAPLNLQSNIVIHCTITGLGGSSIEPNVNPWIDEFIAATKLLNKYGPERVVLRIDPILWEPYTTRALDVFREAQLAGFRRIRISFIDMYPHVRKRFETAEIAAPEGFHLPLDFRRSVWEGMNKPEVCGEPGLPCSGCVSARDVTAMGIDKPLSGHTGFQRKTCLCAAEKVELLNQRGQCSHGCLYCYWR